MFTQESGHRAPLSPGPSGYYTVSPPSYYTSSPPSSSFSLPLRNDFLAIRAKATLSLCSGSAMGYAPPLLQVGQPNLAIRQDIHHYPVGWSKWPWCSLHTQFQIPLGSIMGRFKQRERGRPSHLILTILDVISVWCSTEKKSNMWGTGKGGGVWRERVSQQVMKARQKIKME